MIYLSIEKDRLCGAMCSKLVKNIYHMYRTQFSRVRFQNHSYLSSINKEIRDDLDSVIIFKSRHERWLDKDILGLKIDSTSPFL